MRGVGFMGVGRRVVLPREILMGFVGKWVKRGFVLGNWRREVLGFSGEAVGVIRG